MKVLSLGAGVQSSALLFMYQDLAFLRRLARDSIIGKIVPNDLPITKEDFTQPDAAVFSDTGSEPKEVYDWLNFLTEKSKIPIFIAKKEGSTLFKEPDEHKFSTVPLFYINKETGKKGIGRRFCTKLYKIEPVDTFIKRKILKMKKYERMKDKKVVISMGISYDELGRMREPQEKWKTHVYPLVEYGIKRKDCQAYLVEKLGKMPPRSACTFCPYKTDQEFKELKEKNPKDFQNAVEFDNKIRHLKPGIIQYVHRSLKPLSEIDFDKVKQYDKQQSFTFSSECEGMCGV